MNLAEETVEYISDAYGSDSGVFIESDESTGVELSSRCPGRKTVEVPVAKCRNCDSKSLTSILEVEQPTLEHVAINSV